MLIRQAPVENKRLASPFMDMARIAASRRPTDNLYSLTVKFMKPRKFNARCTAIFKFQIIKMFGKMRCVFGIKLMKFYQYDASVHTMRLVLCANRIAHISAGRKIPMLIRKHSLYNKKLFPAAMHMRAEEASRRVAHKRCSPRHFSANPVEHFAFHTGERRGHPLHIFRKHDDRLIKFCMYSHVTKIGELTPDNNRL